MFFPVRGRAIRTSAWRSGHARKAALLPTGTFEPIAVASVERREKPDGTPWWRITTTTDEVLYTLDQAQADALARFIGTHHPLRLAWEETQVADRRHHHLLRVEVLDETVAPTTPLTADDSAF